MYTWPSLAVPPPPPPPGRMRVTVCGLFLFLNHALYEQLLPELSIKEQLLSILSHQKGPLKFTDFALFFPFAQDGSPSALNYKTGAVLDDMYLKLWHKLA